MMKPENAQRIWDHLNNNGYVYICGDAKNMSREVNAALRHAIVTVGGKTADEAEKFMENLSARGKYAADVW
jgi:sulfite reductase alpha subunit-like flavoprotein